MIHWGSWRINGFCWLRLEDAKHCLCAVGNSVGALLLCCFSCSEESRSAQSYKELEQSRQCLGRCGIALSRIPSSQPSLNNSKDQASTRHVFHTNSPAVTLLPHCDGQGQKWWKLLDEKLWKNPRITQEIQTTQERAEGRGQHLEDLQPHSKLLWGRHRLLIKFSHSWERLLEHPWIILPCYFELAWRFPPAAHSCLLLPLSGSNSAQCAHPWSPWCSGNLRHSKVLGVCCQWHKTLWAY